MAFPYATLCVQGVKDGVSRAAIEAQFENYGTVVRCDITPNKQMIGVPDTRIAIVEFKHRDDARKAMRALNGRYVQGKCVMVRFARSAAGVRPPAPRTRQGAPELIPQTACHAKMLAAKFHSADGDDADTATHRRDGSPERARSEGRRRLRRGASPTKKARVSGKEDARCEDRTESEFVRSADSNGDCRRQECRERCDFENPRERTERSRQGREKIDGERRHLKRGEGRSERGESPARDNLERQVRRRDAEARNGQRKETRRQDDRASASEESQRSGTRMSSSSLECHNPSAHRSVQRRTRYGRSPSREARSRTCARGRSRSSRSRHDRRRSRSGR
uniref:RRM domain-containing protein n=1 Tax=Noctiluca scintillans TaxID=2966 RepID=A0A7S1AEI2_NOCSC|mmetsp:Transcript_4303/g.12208  ORF Transcript_4303/g.12208 Transcript_4303/m.12208 type:complete len:336 (+) Transcript_4303:40-1047(+)